MSLLLNFLCWTILSFCLVKCSDDEIKPLLLFEATNEANEEVTKWLLDHGADVNVRDATGKTPFMKLIEINDTVEMAEFLLKNGADIDLADSNGNTALHITAINGKTRQFQFLMDKKANIMLRDKRGRTVLHSAADHERCAIIKTCGSSCKPLLNSTDHWGRTPLWYSANRGNYECYAFLKEMGAKPVPETLVAGVNGGNLDIVGDLLYTEKNINEKNASGLSLVQIACDRKHNEVAKYLIVKGADIKIRDNEHRNLLQICSGSGLDEVVSILIEGGLDVNSTDVEGYTALHYAAMNDKPGVLSTLQGNGGNIRARNKANKTPVELAVENNSLRSLAWFIQNGYDINELTSSKKTLCHVAAGAGSIPALELLIKMGADCDQTSESGNRPIHYAVHYSETLKTLLKAGVQLDAPGVDGITPLEIAVYIGNKISVMCLLKYGATPNPVRDRPSTDKRYYAYVTNPLINTRLELTDIIKKVKDGAIKPSAIEC